MQQTAPTGRTGKEEKEGNMGVEESGWQVRRENAPQQFLDIDSLSSLKFSLAILDYYI